MNQYLLILSVICVTGIFFLPNIYAQTPEFQSEQSIYEKLVGQSIITKFFGYVDNQEKGGRVLITITSPEGTVIENRIYPSNDGYFELFQSLDKNASIGFYDVAATYHNKIIDNISFELIDNGNYSLKTEIINHNEESQIPTWVKNIFIWYGQDLVSEKELLTSIKFLLNDGIIILDR